MIFYITTHPNVVTSWRWPRTIGSGSALERTLLVVRELLRRGLLAGDSPADGIHFNAWRSQEPDLVCQFIRRGWEERGARLIGL